MYFTEEERHAIGVIGVVLLGGTLLLAFLFGR